MRRILRLAAQGHDVNTLLRIPGKTHALAAGLNVRRLLPSAVSYLLEGHLAHRDSLGTVQTIAPPAPPCTWT